MFLFKNNFVIKVQKSSQLRITWFLDKLIFIWIIAHILSISVVNKLLINVSYAMHTYLFSGLRYIEITSRNDVPMIIY